MIILVGNQKGGCGKSTTVTNICAYLVNEKYDVVLVDADRQPTAANWAEDRKSLQDAVTVHCVQKYENIRETLLDLDGRYDYVIVDAAGRDSRELRTGMIAADKIVIPFKTSQPDLDVLPHMQEIIQEAQDLNPKLKAYGVLSMASTNPKVTEITDAKEVFTDFPGIHLLETVIYDRKSYRDAISEGQGITEFKDRKASKEFNDFMKELIGNGKEA